MRATGIRLALSCTLALGAATATSLVAPKTASAWDPSTTHQGLLEEALMRSALHRRWMDATQLQRGVFTPLRVDPYRLSEAERLMLRQIQHHAHADSGAHALGGPGACPPASAPVETQAYCVRGDLWQLPAVGWIRLGILAEVTPTARHTHHFLDREDPTSLSWDDRELPRLVLRSRQNASNGEPLAGVMGATNFAGKAPSALGWLRDARDPLAPARMFHHLEKASLSKAPEVRDHHLAMALICLGALLHVSQDLAVPAHARGDASAFFAQLSPVSGDRGLPFQEWTRIEYGRRDLPLGARPETPSGVPVAQSLAGHFVGEGQWEGVGMFAGRRFFSESSVPRPRFVDEESSREDAAAALLEGANIWPAELEGATLSRWPAETGYILSATGRALAAFDTDDKGRIRPYLDEACYREMAAQLLPLATTTTSSLLDFVWPESGLESSAAAASESESENQIHIDPNLVDAALHVMTQDKRGQRSVQKVIALRPGERRSMGGLVDSSGESTRTVLVLVATRKDGSKIVAEQWLGGGSSKAAPAVTRPARPDTDPEAGSLPESEDPALEEPELPKLKSEPG